MTISTRPILAIAVVAFLLSVVAFVLASVSVLAGYWVIYACAGAGLLAVAGAMTAAHLTVRALRAS